MAADAAEREWHCAVAHVATVEGAAPLPRELSSCELAASLTPQRAAGRGGGTYGRRIDPSDVAAGGAGVKAS